MNRTAIFAALFLAASAAEAGTDPLLKWKFQVEVIVPGNYIEGERIFETILIDDVYANSAGGQSFLGHLESDGKEIFGIRHGKWSCASMGLTLGKVSGAWCFQPNSSKATYIRTDCYKQAWDDNANDGYGEYVDACITDAVPGKMMRIKR
ncbi:MAG TPA: hypothetical protein VNL74_05345 [Methylococcus sp.]|nr:hypothetical protein [Methylococcus sp.]